MRRHRRALFHERRSAARGDERGVFKPDQVRNNIATRHYLGRDGREELQRCDLQHAARRVRVARLTRCDSSGFNRPPFERSSRLL